MNIQPYTKTVTEIIVIAIAIAIVVGLLAKGIHFLHIERSHGSFNLTKSLSSKIA